MKSTKKIETVTILENFSLQQHSTLVWVMGTSPLVYNAMSVKAQRELLLPAPKGNTATRLQSLKHDPVEEFRNSTYQLGYSTSSKVALPPPDDRINKQIATRLQALLRVPPRLCFPSSGFKKALMTAALDIPGATKAQIGRLSWVTGERVPVWGCPKVYMRPVRSADMNRTPDIRTRAILDPWCSIVRINFVTPQLNERNLLKLLGAAGILCGIGDYRQERGVGNSGQFALAYPEPNDPYFPQVLEILASGGRAAQDEALANPVAYDEETLQLYDWVTKEIEVRRKDMAKATITVGSKKLKSVEVEILPPVNELEVDNVEAVAATAKKYRGTKAPDMVDIASLAGNKSRKPRAKRTDGLLLR